MNTHFFAPHVHVREVERVDEEIILLTLEAHGTTFHTVVRKQPEPNMRYSDEAFDDLERQLRVHVVP